MKTPQPKNTVLTPQARAWFHARMMQRIARRANGKTLAAPSTAPFIRQVTRARKVAQSSRVTPLDPARGLYHVHPRQRGRPPYTVNILTHTSNCPCHDTHCEHIYGAFLYYHAALPAA